VAISPSSASLANPFSERAPAAIAGEGPEADIVLLAAREVDEVRARLARWHDHQVHLGPAGEAHRGLVAPRVHDRLDHRQRREAADEGGRVVRLGEQVEVTDRLAAASERAGRRESQRAWGILQELITLPGAARRAQGLRADAVQRLDPRPQALDRLLAKARRRGQRARPERHPKVLEALDAEPLPQEPDGPGPHARDPQQLGQRRRDLPVEPLEESQPPGGDELGDLVRDRLADSRTTGGCPSR